jgi:serine/threonine protein kinase
LTTPERLGRYRILKELGQGGFATVFLAEDRSLDTRVAIKVLSPRYSADPDIVPRFITEARVLRNLAAPGLVAVHDSGEHEGCPFFVMEYCERGSIGDRVRRLGRPLTTEEGLGLAKAIGNALVGVHRGDPPIVHRDLKPENLLLRATPRHRREPIGDLVAADEQVIIGDFGLAKVVDSSATNLTLLAFTKGYAAPEQSKGDPTVGPQADVFAASAVIVSLVSGRPPRQVWAHDDHAFDQEAMASTGPMHSELARGLHYDPERRHPDLGAWSEALHDAVTNHQNPAVSTPGRHRPNVLMPTRRSPWTPVPKPQSGPLPAPQQPVPANGGPPPPTPAPAVTDRPAQAHQARATAPERYRSRRLRFLLAVAAMAGVALGLGALVTSGWGSGSASVVGPKVAVVGDEVAFVPESGIEVTGWEIDGQRAEGDVLVLTPVAPGEVMVLVTTSDGSTETMFEVVERASALSIEGPGLLPAGETTELSATGADGAPLTWVVGGQTIARETLELTPTGSGVLTVAVSTEGGARAERSFTVSDFSP